MILLAPVSGTKRTMESEDVEMIEDHVSEEEILSGDKDFGQLFYVFIAL